MPTPRIVEPSDGYLLFKSEGVPAEGDGERDALPTPPLAAGTTTAPDVPPAATQQRRGEGTKVVTLEKRGGESWGFSVAKGDSGATVISKVSHPA